MASPGWYKTDPFKVNSNPGFTFGRSGNCPTGTWLLNDTVPSHKAGRPIFLNDPLLSRVIIRAESPTTCTISVYEHTGGATQVLISSHGLVASRDADYVVSHALTNGKDLAVRVVSGSAKNIQVSLFIEGTK